MRRNHVAWIPVALVLGLAGCSGEDDGASSGTCDWTANADHRTCLEQSGNPMDIATQREACESNAGIWTSDSCPVNADLIGCCSYELGLSFRECFYTRPERTYDPASRCTNTTFNGVPGVWTPAPPPG